MDNPHNEKFFAYKKWSRYQKIGDILFKGGIKVTIGQCVLKSQPELTEASAGHSYKIDRHDDIDHTQTKIQPQTEHVQSLKKPLDLLKGYVTHVANGETYIPFFSPCTVERTELDKKTDQWLKTLT